jgi:hypothetical protein
MGQIGQRRTLICSRRDSSPTAAKNSIFNDRQNLQVGRAGLLKKLLWQTHMFR